MTEPVAYLAKSRTTDSVLASIHEFNPNGFENIPLYTSEQLHPRVKMTQAEFDEFKQLIEEYGFVLEALQAIYNGKYKNLNSKLFNGRTVESDNKQVKILTNLMSEFDPNNPEETIEIVPETKWFVHKKDCENEFRFLQTSAKHLSYNFPKHSATQFDTEEEAEKWTNPLTEAVQLPVEDE